MISTKYVAIIAVAAFVSGSFVASPELRAYAAATITSADIVNETIRTVDIKDGEVKSPDIADGAVRAEDIGTDAVGDEELEGEFTCVVPGTVSNVPSRGTFLQRCDTPFSGGLAGGFVIATLNSVLPAHEGVEACFAIMGASGNDDEVEIMFKNTCATAKKFDGGTVSLLAFR
jgi:hypothetical protein